MQHKHIELKLYCKDPLSESVCCSDALTFWMPEDQAGQDAQLVLPMNFVLNQGSGSVSRCYILRHRCNAAPQQDMHSYGLLHRLHQTLVTAVTAVAVDVSTEQTAAQDNPQVVMCK